MTGARRLMRAGPLAYGGGAVSRPADAPEGKVAFVAGAAPGDLVEVEVMAERSRYDLARVASVVEPGPDRVPHACPLVGRCGGCQWQHLRPTVQWQARARLLAEELQRAAPGWDGQVEGLPTRQSFSYRSRARFQLGPPDVGGSRWLCFHSRRSGQVTPVAYCPISNAALNAALGVLNSPTWRGRWGADLEQLEVTATVPARDLALRALPSSSGPAAWPPGWWQELRSALAAVEVNLQPLGGTVREEMRGWTAHVPASAFLQAHHEELPRLWSALDQAVDRAGLVIDGYAGVGTLGLSLLLSGRARRLIAVEPSAGAVNALYRAVNELDLADKVEVLRGTLERHLGGLAERAHGATVVFDPPREGCSLPVRRWVLRQRPKRVVMVSCDLATLGRDLRSLTGGGYRLGRAWLIDLFPQTYHLEAVVSLDAPDGQAG